MGLISSVIIMKWAKNWKGKISKLQILHCFVFAYRLFFKRLILKKILIFQILVKFKLRSYDITLVITDIWEWVKNAIIAWLEEYVAFQKKNGVDETFRYKCRHFFIFSWENLKKEPRNILPNEAFEYLSSHLIIWTRKIVHTKYFSTWKLVHENFFCCKVHIFWEGHKNLRFFHLTFVLCSK